MAGEIRIKYDLKGIGKTQRALKAIGYSITAVDARNAAKYAIEVAKKEAEANIPRGSITHSAKTKGTAFTVYPPYASTQVITKAKKFKNNKGGFAILGVRQPAYYASMFVEFGTKFQQAQPWLQPSFLKTSLEQMVRMTKWFDRKLKRVVKQRGKR